MGTSDDGSNSMGDMASVGDMCDSESMASVNDQDMASDDQSGSMRMNKSRNFSQTGGEPPQDEEESG